MIKKAIFIVLTILLLIAVVNRVDTTDQKLTNNIAQTFENVIGCEDYRYKFYINVPATVAFYVTKSNGIDEMGLFKTIDAYQNESTILHCGNNYRVVYSAPGYKEYCETIEVKGFKPIWEEAKIITLEKS